MSATKLNKRQQAQQIAILNQRKAEAERQRDALIARYEAKQAAGATHRELEGLGDDINQLHDDIETAEQGIRYIETGPHTDKGDYMQPWSQWHY